MKVTAFLLSWALPVVASGPMRVALIDRSASPVPISSIESFNLDSRLSILACCAEINPASENDTTAASAYGLKTANGASVNGWRESFRNDLVVAYAEARPADRLAFIDLPEKGSFAELRAAAARLSTKAPASWKPWLTAEHVFFSDYLFEQERLAAYWPRITSEIRLFDSSAETNGSGLPDRTFSLTFDDGPGPVGSSTDQIISRLRSDSIPATFFLLSDQIIASEKDTPSLPKRYENMRVGSHGEHHDPFPKLTNPKESFDRCRTLFETVFGIKPETPIPLRPPYGQRTESVVRSAQSLSMPLMLWDIDSQDWQERLTARQIADRVETLILLRRHGIILFHDVYVKSADALNLLLADAGTNRIFWR